MTPQGRGRRERAGPASADLARLAASIGRGPLAGFFGEPGQFEFLTESVLPVLADSRLQAWSECCGSGEDTWSLAMAAAEFAASRPGFDFSVLATDASADALARASMAVYAEESIAGIGEPLRRKYLLRSRDRAERRVRIAPELRAKVRFAHLEPGRTPAGMAVVFCRTRAASSVERLAGALAPGGYLFLHPAEAVDCGETLAPAAPGVYRRRAQ
jgi:chemotaxis protein methyltransferase CheR